MSELSREEAIELILNVFADRPSGPLGGEVLAALGITVEPYDSGGWIRAKQGGRG